MLTDFESYVKDDDNKPEPFWHHVAAGICLLILFAVILLIGFGLGK